uniref:Uncharacterized protein n=1 Tax=Paramormyrops kingsleyae TaxID=1676925 RepID=A0A3B3RV59_9TELE
MSSSGPSPRLSGADPNRQFLQNFLEILLVIRPYWLEFNRKVSLASAGRSPEVESDTRLPAMKGEGLMQCHLGGRNEWERSDH